jgi:protein-S-isoprenylcysteine O-methyltransferase Ste14
MGFLIGVLGVGIFASAGTLGFGPGWVYLAVFGSCTSGITLWLILNDRALLERRVQAGPVAETRASQKVIQSLAGLLFVGLFVGSGLDDRFGWTLVSDEVVALSDLLVALGFWIVFLVFRANTYTSGTIEVAHGQKVIDHGPYALVRHPMYSGGGLLILATPPALGSWAALPLSVGLILVLVARIVDEERFLEANLEGYRAYREKVRWRLVPWVW